jgi:hypothetical protein
MSVQPLDLRKLSYPKPTPPPSTNPMIGNEWVPLLMSSPEDIFSRYQNELANWNTHQTQIQDAALQWTAQQQEMNDKYSTLLAQNKAIQKELVAEKESHAKETQEIQTLKTNMLTITKILRDVLSETEVKQENTKLNNSVAEITRIMNDSLIEDKK